MNKTPSEGNEPNVTPYSAPVGEDLLPPVEPPSAGFIIQLFVVPALIVIAIVSVWLTFNWLVRRTATQPQDLIQGLEQGPSIARWQRASELADMLRNERFAEFKRSGESAAHLGRILERELDLGGSSGAMDEGEVTLRYFLTRALGEFEVQEGTAELLKAATTNRGPEEQIVRHGALEAIAVRAFKLREHDPPQMLQSPDLEPTLFRLAEDEDPLIRSQTAYALGQIGTPSAIERLEVMVDDPDRDTRYNAAIALAHRGNEASIETLAEMLELDEVLMPDADAEVGGTPSSNLNNRSVIIHTAIEATKDLAQKNPTADLSLIVAALQRIASADDVELSSANISPQLAVVARGALRILDQPARAKGS